MSHTSSSSSNSTGTGTGSSISASGSNTLSTSATGSATGSGSGTRSSSASASASKSSKSSNLTSASSRPITSYGSSGLESGGGPGIVVDARNITVTAPGPQPRCAGLRRIPPPEPITLVNGVSLKLLPGEVTALLGPSGSGKSVLLDALAGRLSSTLDLDGRITYNGADIHVDDAIALSGYVTQDDVLLSALSPRENLTFLARASLASTTAADRAARVKSVLSALSISKVADTRVGVPGLERGLSGGERRRAHIAQSLITSPKILLVDDPTAGLDAATAESVITSLKNLARTRNLSVLISISQASNDLFNMFDHTLVLASGRVAYSGPVPGMLPFFESLGFPCPTGYNPADFAVELLATDLNEEDRAMLRVGGTYQAYAASASVSATSDDGEDETHARIALITRAAKDAGMGVPDDSESFGDSAAAALDYIHVSRPSPFVLLGQLTKRNIRLTLRNTRALVARAVQMLVIGGLVGALYFNASRGERGGLDRAGLAFMVAIFAVFSALQASITAFVEERPTFIRESSEGLYGSLVYLTSKVLANFPFDMGFTLLFAVPVYFLVGLQLEGDKFLIFVAIALELSLLGSWLGLLLSALTGDVDSSNAAAPGAILPAVLFSSFLLRINSIPEWIRWLRHASFFKYAFSSMLINELDGITFSCDNPVNGTCPFPTGQSFIELYEVDHDFDTVGANMAMLAIFPCLTLIGVYFALRLSSRR